MLWRSVLHAAGELLHEVSASNNSVNENPAGSLPQGFLL
jgi:hypothetical protein